MLKSINSPHDEGDDDSKSLKDQRNAHADFHGRLSVAVSNLSDTASVYSHSYFSPRPSDISESRVGYLYSNDSTGRNELQTSILDLTDDPRTSYASQDYDHANSTSSEELADDSETVARMSYLGPKMRVHSRAPWEEEALEEIDEENALGGLSFSRRHAAKSIVSAISSPRPSFAGSVGRQSEDSISQLDTKRSFETINSQVSLSHSRGGLYALAQESLSSHSLGRPNAVKETFLTKFSIGRRGETPTTDVPNIPLIPSPMSSRANNSISTGAIKQLSPIKTNSVSSASSSHDSLEFLSVRMASTHPYANPDLVITQEIQDPSTPSSAHCTLPHSDSEATVTESFFVEKMATSNSQAKTSMSDSSVKAVVSKFRTSPLSNRYISSPVTVISSPQNLHPGVAEHRLPGWTEPSPTSPFSLISLEEARAKRMRSSTDTGAATSDSRTSFPRSSTNYSTSPLANLARARGRSVSAGANAKNTLQNVLGQPKLNIQDSESILKEDHTPGPSSGKTLKNKKSGFMRIFNRDKDIQSVPPMPPIPDEINQSQPSRTLAASSTRRVPVPSLWQPEVSVSQNGRTMHSDILTTNKSSKQSSPSLSINTTIQDSSALAATSRPDVTLGVPSAGSRSAPANLPEFPTLKLRPVSMLFSASFGDLVPSDPSQETSELYTPPSSRSPLTTPISSSGPRYDGIYVVNNETQSAVEVPQEHMPPTKSVWQRHIWELEGQVHDLKAELEYLKNDEYCDKCGRGRRTLQNSAKVINRPQARTGAPSRSVNPRT